MKKASKMLTQIALGIGRHKALAIYVGPESKVDVPGVETVALHSVRTMEAWRSEWDQGRRPPTIAFVSRYLFGHPFAIQFRRRAVFVISPPRRAARKAAKPIDSLVSRRVLAQRLRRKREREFLYATEIAKAAAAQSGL